MTIQDKLNRLAEMNAQRDVMTMNYKELRESVIPGEVKAKLADIDLEWAEPLANIDTGIAALEAEIKAEVEAAGESVKGDYLHAIYTAGRVTWDGKLLEGYSVAHPELLQARKVGKPSVSIRGVK